MSTVVIGGHSRNIGKTSVVCGVLQNLVALKWTAIKITQFGHGVCSVNGKSCHCSTDEHTFVIQDEQDRSGHTDTARFLLAGARKSLWVRTKQGMLYEAWPSLKKQIANEAFVIIESNSIMRFVKPDLYLVVLDYATRDFKSSAKAYLDLADAYILLEPHTTPLWQGISLKPLANKPLFSVRPGCYVTPKIVDFIRERIKVDRCQPEALA